jgi:hypothetical protein
MANLGERKAPTVGWVTLPPAPKARADGKLTDTEMQAIWSALGVIATGLNGNVSLGTGESQSFAGNLDAEVIDFTFPATIDTKVAVPHLLRRVPVGCIVILQDRAGSVYVSSGGSWSESWLYLKSSVANMVARLLVF